MEKCSFYKYHIYSTLSWQWIMGTLTSYYSYMAHPTETEYLIVCYWLAPNLPSLQKHNPWYEELICLNLIQFKIKLTFLNSDFPLSLRRQHCWDINDTSLQGLKTSKQAPGVWSTHCRRGSRRAALGEDRQCRQQPAGFLCCTEPVHRLPCWGRTGLSLYGGNVCSEQENRRV